LKVRKQKIKHKNKNYYYFSVYVNKKGKKGHSEVYRYNINSLYGAMKKQLGYQTNAFFDFKRTNGKNVAGLYKVQSVYTDNKKVYYQTKKGTYSLPLYLKNKVPSEKYILVAERVKKNEV